jgi:NhaA family Na+:H+ antiporter
MVASSESMRELNRDWRRHTRSHTTGLRPHVDPARDHLRGNPDAPLVLVEYGDYVSPSSRAVVAQVHALRARFGDELLYVFRNFVIADAHPQALSASAAAETAGAQGKFWEMHDRILRSEFGVARVSTRKFAQEIGLDLDRFDREMADETHVPHLFEDFNSGVSSGVNGAPTFFVNGARLDWDFKAVTLSEALDRASGNSDLEEPPEVARPVF